MDEASGVQSSLGTQHVSPVFGKLPYPAGKTLPTQAAGSSHYSTYATSAVALSDNGFQR